MGMGKRLLIAIHGFGDNAAMFKVLVAGIGPDYTLWAVDLPGHGRSRWRADAFDRQDIRHIVDAICNQEGKHHYSLLGFSFGGRIVLSLLEVLAKPPHEVFLVAPDGFGTRGMRLASLPPPFFRRWLKDRIEAPQPWLHLAAFLRRWGVLDAYSQRFLRFFLHNEARRQALMCAWISLPNFPVSRRRLRRFLENSGLPAVFILGRHDELIPHQRIEVALEGLSNVRIILLEKDHWLIDDKLGVILRQVGFP